MWYNFDLLKKQHSFMYDAKESYVPYVNVEHVSGNLSIRFSGRKSGIQYETTDFSVRRSTEIRQASYLTMRIYLKNTRNALPEIKCGREHYGDGTMFVIHDKKLADEVLTRLFQEYCAHEDMKEYILTMFDDWENLAIVKGTAYSVSELSLIHI